MLQMVLFRLQQLQFLTLAFVAVYIPINPAVPEQAAPTKNDIAVSQPKEKNNAIYIPSKKVLAFCIRLT